MAPNQIPINEGVEIRTLQRLREKDFDRIASGHESDGFFLPQYSESENSVSLTLEQTDLSSHYKKVNDPIDPETIRRYRKVLKEKFSFGAYIGSHLVGLLVAGRSAWNQSVWVWEFHVEQKHRAQGIGRKLMDSLVEIAQKDGFRIIVCETQNTNAAAIRAYRRLGFKAEGIDISYYSNQDYPDGDIAVFMKRRIDAERANQ